MGADRNQWQFPKNEANKIPGWRADGKGLENKTVPLIGLSLASEIRDFLDTAPYVETRTVLKALDTAKDTVAYLKESGREGVFEWASGDFSAHISADTREAVYVKANAVASASGAWVRRFSGPASVKWSGASGDGAADDYPAINEALALNDYHKAGVHFPEGTYRLTSGSPEVQSNTVITGDGKGRSILVQPNYYSYNRPTVPYVKENVVDWNGLWMDVGTSNVDISGLELRGPFYQSSEAGYTANPVQSWPANNGIHVRGADYQYRKNLPYTGESFNIRIHDCHLEGWAEDAIQTDMVTHVWIERNTIARCGRGGHRGYSCVHAWTQFNSIENLSPGDYLNNGNRMYGVEYTRHYAAGVRVSADFWVVGNRVYNCLQWKGMGTHGGQRGNFLFNDIFDCHHGIGVDMGGFEVEDGISPPRDIKIIGNRILRSAAGDPTEGNGEGGAGHALFLTAYDNTSTHIGRNLVIADNICEGWGSNTIIYGGIWLSRWTGVTITGNVIKDSFGSAIRLRETVSGLNIGSNSFIGVSRTTGGRQEAINVESNSVYGTISGQYIENTDAVNTMTAFFLSNNAAGAGVVIQGGDRFVGLVSKTNIINNALPGSGYRNILAGGYVVVAGGGPATGSPSFGFSSITWESTGSVLLTLAYPATAATNLYVNVSLASTVARLTTWERVSASQVRVRTFTTGGAAVDNSFSIEVGST